MPMPSQHPDLDPILERIWNLVASTPDKLTGQSIPVPPMVTIEEPISESRVAEWFPAMAHLDEALDSVRESGFGDIADAFQAALPLLTWSQNPNYTVEKHGESLLNGYAYAALSGPEGPVYCSAPRGGFYLMGPNVSYPAHAHQPREIYFILSPGAEWRIDGGEWFPAEAGDLIYHDAWQTHEMRSFDKPMLAFAGWVEEGDRLAIDFKNAS